MREEEVCLKSLFRFWATLAGTLLMMALEGPLVTASIARHPDANLNLAAYGVSLGLAIFLESPILRLLSAAIAYVKDRESLLLFRKFGYFHSALMSVLLLLLCTPAVYHLLTTSILQLDPEISARMYFALVIYIPTPFLVGYRRIYQGILIAQGSPQRVTHSTVGRLLAVTLGVIYFPAVFKLEGAPLGAASHLFGMLVEATLSRIFVIPALKKLNALATTCPDLSYLALIRFYYPLALSTTVTLIVPPLESFFLSRGRLPIESLALLPVVNSLLNPFSWSGYAIQDTVIATYAEHENTLSLLRLFQKYLAFGLSLLFTVFVLSPAARYWLLEVNQISLDLLPLALTSLLILAPIPALTVCKGYLRAILIRRKKTPIVLASEVLELLSLSIALFFSIEYLGITGLVGAVSSLTFCSCINTAWLSSWVLRRKR